MTYTVTLAVEGMHCGSCGLLIDETLEDLPGVREATTSVRGARSTVTVDPGACTVADLIDAVRTAGYTATQVTP